MSLHTGIVPSSEIDVSELNVPTKKYVDDQDKLRLAKSGGTLTGGLSMDDNKITDLGTPTANTHASTKKYVDDAIASVPKESNYFVFEFPSTTNHRWKQTQNITGHMFWTNDRDIKLTILAHVFDDDNALTQLNIYYLIYWWTKTGVEKYDWSIKKIKVNEHSAVNGTSLQSFPIFKSITIRDITAFTLQYRYLHTGSIGNESCCHCLIEFI